VVLRLWRLLPRSFQLVTIKMVQRNKRLYRWLLFRHVEAKDRLNGNAHLPPPKLRYRVSASPDAEGFVTVGKRCAADIQSVVQKVGRELESFPRILDFGCGCGRTLVHVRSLATGARFDGTDIDAEAIAWCKQNLDFADFRLSKESPPIDYTRILLTLSTRSQCLRTWMKTTSFAGWKSCDALRNPEPCCC
jgi:hypothetical protein